MSKYTLSLISTLLIGIVNVSAFGEESPSANALNVPLKSTNASIVFSPNSEAELNRTGGTRSTGDELIIDLGEVDFGNNKFDKVWVNMAYANTASADAKVDVYLDNKIKPSNTKLDIPLNIPHIPYESNLEPNSGLYFKNKYSEEIFAFNIQNDDNISKMVSGVMQGILNQEYGRVYLIGEPHHEVQLKDTKRTYTLVPGYINAKYAGMGAIINKYKDQFDKLVVWDETNEWTWPLAQMICAQQKGIPVTQEIKDFIVSTFGWNKEIMDIRYQWSGRLEAYQWAIDNLSKNCHQTLSFSAGLREDYKSNPWRIHDYAAASKGFVFGLNQGIPAEKEMIGKICRAMNYQPGSSTMGYGLSSDGDGLNSAINEFNVGFMVSDYYANGSFWCSYPSKAFQQRKGVAVDAKPGKVYVCVIWSDGDNVQFDANWLYNMFKSAEGRGQIPVGVTMASALQELNPFLLEYFYKNLTPNDELMGGPSGFQFIYGDVYNATGLPQWFDLNNKWLGKAGFHTSCLWNTSNQVRFENYMKTCGLDGVFDGNQRLVPRYINGVVAVDEGAHCWEDGHFINALKSQPPYADKPRFVSLYPTVGAYGVQGYTKLIKELTRLQAECPDTYVYLLPMDLIATVAKYMVEHNGNY